MWSLVKPCASVHHAQLQPALSLSESLGVAAYRRRDGAEWSSSAGGVYEVTPTLVRAGLVI